MIKISLANLRFSLNEKCMHIGEFYMNICNFTIQRDSIGILFTNSKSKGGFNIGSFNRII